MPSYSAFSVLLKKYGSKLAHGSRELNIIFKWTTTEGASPVSSCVCLVASLLSGSLAGFGCTSFSPLHSADSRKVCDLATALCGRVSQLVVVSSMIAGTLSGLLLRLRLGLFISPSSVVSLWSLSEPPCSLPEFLWELSELLRQYRTTSSLRPRSRSRFLSSAYRRSLSQVAELRETALGSRNQRLSQGRWLPCR